MKDSLTSVTDYRGRLFNCEHAYYFRVSEVIDFYIILGDVVKSRTVAGDKL